MKPTVNLDKSGGIPMKKYISGFITGTLAIICMLMFLGASQIEEDSLKVMLGRIAVSYTHLTLPTIYSV